MSELSDFKEAILNGYADAVEALGRPPRGRWGRTVHIDWGGAVYRRAIRDVGRAWHTRK